MNIHISTIVHYYFYSSYVLNVTCQRSTHIYTIDKAIYVAYFISSKQRNKSVHIINVNRTSINIITWNKDKKQAIDTVNRIESVMNDNNADIILVNEFNLKSTDEMVLVNIDNYYLELDQIYEDKGVARSAMYTKKTLKYKRMKEFENKNDS